MRVRVRSRVLWSAADDPQTWCRGRVLLFAPTAATGVVVSRLPGDARVMPQALVAVIVVTVLATVRALVAAPVPPPPLPAALPLHPPRPTSPPVHPLSSLARRAHPGLLCFPCVWSGCAACAPLRRCHPPCSMFLPWFSWQ